MLSTYERNSRLKLITTVLAVLVVAGVVVLADHFKPQRSGTATNASSPITATAPSSTASNSTSQSASDGSSANGSLKDGTYTTTSDYQVPHGSEELQVSITLKDGVVTASTVQNSENNFDSAQYQEEFAAAYKSHVVGQKISSLQLGTISGASDTTSAFNDALSQITSKAQA